MAKAKDYQALSIELDEVLSQLQHPGVTVDQAVTLYKQGLQLIEQLEKHLNEAENQIKTLKLQATGTDA